MSDTGTTCENRDDVWFDIVTKDHTIVGACRGENGYNEAVEAARSLISGAAYTRLFVRRCEANTLLKFTKLVECRETVCRGPDDVRGGILDVLIKRVERTGVRVIILGADPSVVGSKTLRSLENYSLISDPDDERIITPDGLNIRDGSARGDVFEFLTTSRADEWVSKISRMIKDVNLGIQDKECDLDSPDFT